MRLFLLGLGLALVLGACESDTDSSLADESEPRVSVMVDMDASPEDLDALRALLNQPGVDVDVVALSLVTDSECEQGMANVASVLDENGQGNIPVVCGPSGDRGLAGIEGQTLDSLDRILVLGPMTNIAILLERLPEAPILVVTGGFLADLEAAREILERRTVTVIPPSISDTFSSETVAAWLIVDETLGSFAIKEVEVTSSGELSTVTEGSTVRVLKSIDTARLSAMAGEGESGVTATLQEPRLLWRADIGLRGAGHHKRPAVVDGVVIVGGDNGQVHGISIDTGDIVWTVDTGIGSSMATGVAVEDGVAVLSGGDFLNYTMFRRLVAIDIRNESVLWIFNPETLSAESIVISSPVIADGMVYAGTATPAGGVLAGTGAVFALELQTGELLWQSAGFGGPSEPLVDGDDLIIGGIDGTLRVYDRHTGSLRWERELVVAQNGIASRPLASDGVIHVTGDNGSVHALEHRTGEVLWSVQVSTEPIPASPVIADGRLIVAELFGGTTRALDPATGDEIWAASIGDVLGDPIVIEDTVIVGNFLSGRIVGLDIDTGEALWEFETPDMVDGSPVIADGVLIVQAGDLFALELPES